MVYELPDVLPANFPWLSLERDVNFFIEVELHTKPITIPLYQIASCELKEHST